MKSRENGKEIVSNQGIMIWNTRGALLFTFCRASVNDEGVVYAWATDVRFGHIIQSCLPISISSLWNFCCTCGLQCLEEAS